MKRAAIGGVVLGLLLGAAFIARFRILAHGAGLVVGAPGLVEPDGVGPNARWFDDYYTVEAIDDRTFAISEPRYWQKNSSFLIVGDERALLFDAGPGVRDIRPVVASLTGVAVTFIPSHLHYDHTGNRIAFERVAVIDLPHLRERAPDGRLALEFGEHMGVAEAIPAPTLEVDEWLAPGSRVELGGREILVVHTPGHTADSVTLVDPARGYAFAGDFLIPGPLAEFLPGGGMGDYLQGVEALLRSVSPGTRIFGAHPDLLHGPPTPGPPEVDVATLEDLRTTLIAIRAGEVRGSGLYPVIYPVNDRAELWANPSWMQDWAPRYPRGER